MTSDPVEIVVSMVEAMGQGERRALMERLTAMCGTAPPDAVSVTLAGIGAPRGKTRRVWLRTVTRIEPGKSGIEALEGEWCSDDMAKVSAGTLVLVGERWPTKRWHLVKRVYGAREAEVGGVKLAGVEVLVEGAEVFSAITDAARAALAEPTW